MAKKKTTKTRSKKTPAAKKTAAKKPAAKKPAAKKTAGKKTAAKKTAAKKPAAKKPAAKKTAAKKTAGKKTAAKPAAKKTVAKKPAAKKTAAKKPAAKKTAAKKTAAKKTAAKKTAAKKPAAKKTAAKKTSAKKTAAKAPAAKRTAGKKTAAKPAAKKAAAKKAAAKAPAAKTSAKKTTTGKKTSSKKASKKTATKKTAGKKTTGGKKTAAKKTGSKKTSEKAASRKAAGAKPSEGQANASSPAPSFGPEMFAFLTEVGLNNEREWFKEHRARYEADVREPARAFIRAVAGPLAEVSAHFEASDKKVGGSLMRIHRDVRFSKDKAPYKTNVGIHFRHEAGRDIHAPGFFVHMEPGRHFVGVGMWRPDATALAAIRKRIDDEPEAWVAATTGDGFTGAFTLAGESLKRAPKGFGTDHPHLDALKRKDHIATASLTDEDVLSAGLVDQLGGLFHAAAPYVRFQCEALEIPF